MNKAKIGEWFKAAGIRAVKTIAQTAIATIGTCAIIGEVNWLMVASHPRSPVFCLCSPA